MSQIVILGAGPAACLLALALARQGMQPLLIGRRRAAPAVEGLSLRVVEALRQLGCSEALALLGPRWNRVSSWNGETAEMNGEFAIERVAFDGALLRDVRGAGIVHVDALVRGLQRTGSGAWQVCWEDAKGETGRTEAGLVAECRGHTAPKTTPDHYAGTTLVALGRSFDGARPQPHTTLVESFPAGWAWGGVDPLGRAHVQVVILPELLAAHGGELDAAHAACMEQLRLLPDRIGRWAAPTGRVRARGIQAVLRGACAAPDVLRLGDAAYTCDPLSGHGVFEAASAAIAAVPVINTLLQRPDQAELALRYLRERAELLFFSRLDAAREHYTAETRWSGEAFWQRMSAPVPKAASQPMQPGAADFATVPVVEDGFIVERRVVVSDAHPRGVRFIDGVDLARLDELLRADPGAQPDELSRRLQAPCEAIGQALRWMQARALAPRAA